MIFPTTMIGNKLISINSGFELGRVERCESGTKFHGLRTLKRGQKRAKIMRKPMWCAFARIKDTSIVYHNDYSEAVADLISRFTKEGRR
jgi:hypothetical protein